MVCLERSFFHPLLLQKYSFFLKLARFFTNYAVNKAFVAQINDFSEKKAVAIFLLGLDDRLNLT